MDIHEYQAAEILASYGIPINAGTVCTTPGEVAAAAREMGGTVVVKAQVHIGGRGKAGGVKLARTPDQAREAATQILGMDIRGHTVRKVLVVPGVDIQREYYLGVTVDRAARGVTVMASSAGGIDIEQVAHETPEKIHRELADPFLGLHEFQARRIAFALGIEPKLVNGFAAIATKLYEAFVTSDASLVEVNPLVLTGDGAWQALDSKITIDDNALARRPAFAGLRDLAEENPTEMEAKAAGINFVKLDGNIGCMVNGAGLAMATMDAVKRSGGEPANFLDAGGGSNAEQVATGLRLILSDPKVQAVLVNIFGGITRCDVVARGLLTAIDAIKPSQPFVIRLVGTNQAEGRQILADAGFSAVDTMQEAARQVVAAAGSAA
ncbi:MAG TPA: ADP-forming succinate--CoA ligase subunit beta [Thermomicrobiaceae bacterium]|nr:ADP-forming succinate--CoA ligase subunit beta [Thermomicrobiaceae bacterium]